MKEELKPCPWCGHKPRKRLGGYGHSEDDYYMIVSHPKNCFLFEMFGQIIIPSKHKAWNTRTPERKD